MPIIYQATDIEVPPCCRGLSELSPDSVPAVVGFLMISGPLVRRACVPLQTQSEIAMIEINVPSAKIGHTNAISAIGILCYRWG